MQHRNQLAHRCGMALCAALLAAGCGSDAANDAAPATTTTSIAAPPSTPAVVDESAETSSARPTSAASEPTPIASTTTIPVAATTVADRPDGCRRLTDFDDADDGWMIVNDGVMGGRSNGALEFGESTMRFSGNVVTAGGGFTSVRRQLDGNELDDSTSMQMRVRADTRTYGLTFEDDTFAGRRPISHNGSLVIAASSDADGWTIATLVFDQLRPSIFGQSIDADPFNADQASEIGIIIADGIDGEFALEVDWIDACVD